MAKKINSIVNLTSLLILCLVVFCLFSGCGNVSSEVTTSITLLHFNDLGGNVTPLEDDSAGLARIATLIKEEKNRNPACLLLVSGDLITGSALSSLTKGEAIFRLANLLGIDAFTPGNHEFDYGVPQYMKFMKIADFPFLTANMEYEGRVFGDAPFVIFTVGGEARVGVIGLISKDTPWLTFKENTIGVVFSTPAEIANKFLPNMESQSHLIVALTHQGLEDDKKLALTAKGIDVIVGGHSHDYLFKPVRVENTWIVQAGEEGRYVGIVRIRIEKKSEKILNFHSELKKIDSNISEDADVSESVQSEERMSPVNINEPLGEVTKFMAKNKDVARWVAKALKDYAKADLGMVNIGGIRADLQPGPITLAHIFRVMPFDNYLVVVEIRGEMIIKWLGENKIVLDRRIKIKKNEIYKVATMDFVAGIFRLSNPKNTGVLVQDVLVEDLKTRKKLP